jgi:hypothetical protein
MCVMTQRSETKPLCRKPRERLGHVGGGRVAPRRLPVHVRSEDPGHLLAAQHRAGAVPGISHVVLFLGLCEKYAVAWLQVRHLGWRIRRGYLQ